MPIRNFSLIAVMMSLFLGSPLVVGCGLQQKGKGQLANQKSNSSSQDIDDFNGVGLYGNSIDEHPKDADVYNDMCAAKFDLQDYRGAIAYCSEAIKINPNHAVAFYNRANSKSELNDIKGAISDYSKAIEIDPSDDVVYVNRGGVKFQSNDYHGAIVDYGKAIEINPRNNYAFGNRCNSKIELEDYAGGDFGLQYGNQD